MKPDPRPPSFRQPNVEPRSDPDKTAKIIGWVIVGVVILIVIIASSSSRPGAANSAADTSYVPAPSNAIAPQGPPPVEPLASASVTRGVAHLRMAFAAEGFSGAMIYSQNCYDALAHQFNWARLDQCGAFDAIAARSVVDADMTGLDNEASWFQSETAAARFLAAATGAGENADEADRRFSDIQSRVSRSRTVGRTPAPPASNLDNTVNTAVDQAGGDEE